MLEKDEEILDLKVPYLSAIRALIYLVNCTIPYMFLQSIYQQDTVQLPQKRYWNDIKHILHYLYGTTKIGLFKSGSNLQLIRYENAGYLSDPHKKISQTIYLFIYKGTAIS